MAKDTSNCCFVQPVRDAQLTVFRDQSGGCLLSEQTEVLPQAGCSADHCPALVDIVDILGSCRPVTTDKSSRILIVY